MKSREEIDALFHPRNVALVGASDRRDHWSGRVWDNLRRFGYGGAVYPVNPRRDELWGGKCFHSLADLPEKPDHLAIFTPSDVTLEVLRQGGAAGARSATLYAAGFGEGGEGQDRARALRAVLAATGITAIGPACMGLASGPANFATIPDETLQPLASGPVALAAQSGAICGSINRAVNALGLQMAYIASCGGQIGCTLGDFVAYFAEQPELRAILCYIESLPDAARFLEAARLARRNGKTVIAVKVGGSEASRASALAHTGALAGQTEVFEAYAAAAGVVTMDSLEDAIEALEFVARRPLPRGGKIAALTVSGALCSLITEGAAQGGAELARFSAATTAKIAGTLNESHIDNPVDTRRTRPTEEYCALLDVLIEAPEIDVIAIADELPEGEGAARKTSNLRALEAVSHRAAAAGKSLCLFAPLLVGESMPGRALRENFASVPFLRTTGRALRVMGKLGEAGARPLQDGPFFPASADTQVTRSWRARAATLDKPTSLNEAESKTLLQAYGIGGPVEQTVLTIDEAVRAATKIGFPVVLKGLSAGIAHKSDAGLVLLNLADEDGVRAGAAQLHRRAQALGAPLDGLLVAQMIRGGTETVLGIGRDPEMGCFVMFGMGGIMVELFRDVRFGPAGLTGTQAQAMIAATRVDALLQGFRGAPAGDRPALVRALVNLGRLAADLGDVLEAVDINPLVVRQDGVLALDALVVLRPPPAKD